MQRPNLLGISDIAVEIVEVSLHELALRSEDPPSRILAAICPRHEPIDGDADVGAGPVYQCHDARRPRVVHAFVSAAPEPSVMIVAVATRLRPGENAHVARTIARALHPTDVDSGSIPYSLDELRAPLCGPEDLRVRVPAHMVGAIARRPGHSLLELRRRGHPFEAPTVRIAVDDPSASPDVASRVTPTASVRVWTVRCLGDARVGRLEVTTSGSSEIDAAVWAASNLRVLDSQGARLHSDDRSRRRRLPLGARYGWVVAGVVLFLTLGVRLDRRIG